MALQILLVDDDVAYREYVIFVLEKTFRNIQIQEAGTIQDALSLLHKNKFGFIILDYNLPDGLGPELLKKRSEYLSDCPVIILTGLKDDEVGLASLQAGAEDYLVKDEITPFTLKRSIRYAIQRYNRRAQFEIVTSELHSSNVKLKNANEKLEGLIVTDSLTGIANRRAFQYRLMQLLNESRRGRKFALIMADIDHFKKFNDTYGHQIGDYVLTEVANVLSKTARETDFVARWGGEEFCILLTEVDEARAKLQGERLRQAIHLISDYKITMSFGICVATKTMDADVIVRLADTALYHAKSNGRDRVVSFEDIKILSDGRRNLPHQAGKKAEL